MKQTAKAAAVAGLAGCGPLLQGCFSKRQFDWVIKNALVYDGLGGPPVQADLVIFDPERIADRATWLEPHQYPIGIEYVIVNGKVVIQGGEHSGQLPGRVLKKKA